MESEKTMTVHSNLPLTIKPCVCCILQGEATLFPLGRVVPGVDATWSSTFLKKHIPEVHIIPDLPGYHAAMNTKTHLWNSSAQHSLAYFGQVISYSYW